MIGLQPTVVWMLVTECKQTDDLSLKSFSMSSKRKNSPEDEAEQAKKARNNEGANNRIYLRTQLTRWEAVKAELSHGF